MYFLGFWMGETRAELREKIRRLEKNRDDLDVTIWELREKLSSMEADLRKARAQARVSAFLTETGLPPTCKGAICQKCKHALKHNGDLVGCKKQLPCRDFEEAEPSVIASPPLPPPMSPAAYGFAPPLSGQVASIAEMARNAQLFMMPWTHL